MTLDLLRQILQAIGRFLTVKQAQQNDPAFMEELRRGAPPEGLDAQPVPPAPTPIVPAPAAPALSFVTPRLAWHATRVMCDSAGLSLADKNILCACVYQESQFFNTFGSGQPVKHQNIVNGKVSSTDWGICQINDYYHIGAGKDFPSVAYVIAHPEAAIAFMIRCMKGGQINLWSSYTSGAYKKWLSLSSPMWALAAK